MTTSFEPTIALTLYVLEKEVRLERGAETLHRHRVNTRQAIHNALTRLYLDLDAFRQNIWRDDLNRSSSSVALERGGEALVKVFDRMSLRCNDIFGSSKDLDRLSRALRSAWPTWRTDEPGTAQLQILVDEPGLPAPPFEFLPLLDLERPKSIETLDDLHMLARRFPGFSMQVERYIAGTVGLRESRLWCEPKLNVVAFGHADLDGPDSEVRVLEAASDLVDLDGPWGWQDNTDPAGTVAWRLRDPSTSFDGELRRPDDQIAHFSCHCETRAGGSPPHVEDVTLFLKAPEQVNEVAIGMDALQISWNEQGHRPAVRPLVVMNACGSAEVHPATFTSVPSMFLGEGHVGFVGAEVAVPDSFAKDFGRAFYSSLFFRNSVARAVFDARWSMLRRHHNPFGLVYSCYTSPDLRLSRPLLGTIDSDEWSTSDHGAKR